MNINIKDLSVQTKDNKKILKNLDLEIKSGEIHVIMGPNGVGKSTLSKVIMRHFDYIITGGNILINNESILSKTTDEVANMGVFLSYQNPPQIEGVTNSEFLRSAINRKEEKVSLYKFIQELDKSLDDLNMPSSMIHRSINKDFSGGERKKNEILQMKMLKPKFLILDELDSGLDVDSLKIVCKNINEYLENNKDVCVLMITHYPKILEYIKPDFVHILNDNKIIKSGDYKLALEIEKNGYNVMAEGEVYE